MVAYQKILQLSYVDKFLNDIHLEFRDKYKNELAEGQYFQNFNFTSIYNNTLRKAEEWSKLEANKPKQMRSFEESQKSKKTVSSMIERKGEEKPVKNAKKKEVNFAEGRLISNGLSSWDWTMTIKHMLIYDFVLSKQFPIIKLSAYIFFKIVLHMYTGLVWNIRNVFGSYA